MKNLMIYVSPDKKFSPEHEVLTKIQIDNSLELGWKSEDIVLVMNFPWEYRGINAFVVDGDFNHFDGNRSSKIAVINKLFELGKVDDLMWFHDHDAFQTEWFNAPEVEVAAFTDHGYMGEWNAGSFFFTVKADQLFKDIFKTMEEKHMTEQKALTYMWSKGLKSQMINQTYNVGIYRHDRILPKLQWPMLVVHFHPIKPKHLEIFRKYIPMRLLLIFSNYGIDIYNNTEVSQKIADLKALKFDKKVRYREWEPYLSKYHCDIIAELGVRQGFHFEYLIKHNPKEAVAVDCWIDDGFSGRNDACYDQSGLDRQYNKFKGLMADKPFVRIIREYTFDAVRRFPDEYFDYIFIDADHTYEGISRDLVDWWPKMKKGGVFCGHDYVRRTCKNVKGERIKFGVVDAVNEFVKKNNITNFFILYPNTTWGVIK